jgi:peptidoglycan-N-acetylmuramic acid deacetylase
MVDEGHLVGNHSVTHPNVAKLTPEEIYEQIVGCEEAFYEVTGEQMDLYFRQPQGAYSPQMMQIIEDLGYKTIFWSIAYNDYEEDNQPGRDYVIKHFNTYHHNGAIPLMHNDSVSNREAMEDVLDLLKDAGYRFGTLDELK